MKKLYITRQQARALASDLQEYSGERDSSNRDMFQGFKISFGDLFTKEMQPDDAFEITPIPNYLEIPKDNPDD